MMPNATALEELVIIKNDNLTGAIPNLSHLTKLTALRLEQNQLQGTIPEVDALRKLTTLRFWENRGDRFNGLTGSIPDISRLTNLKDFSFSR